MGSRVLRGSPLAGDFSQQESCLLCRSGEKLPLFLKDGFEISKCPRCGLVYTFPQDLLPLEQIYSEQYYHSSDPFFGYLDYQGYERLFKKTFRRRIVEIEKRTHRGRLLDVGCALGFFVEVARERGWDAYGVEVSPYAAGFARSRGLSVLEGTVDQADFPPGFFDVVTIWDLFEGLSEPLSALISFRRLLRDEGLLIIGTPNVESLARRILRSKWAHFKPRENRFYFSPPTMGLMLEHARFRVTDISHREGGQFCDLRFISEKLNPVSPAIGRALLALSRLLCLEGVSFYLNSRDRMVVYASKERETGDTFS